jgi:hypothetical protein
MANDNLIRHNREVIKQVIQSNSKEKFEKKGQERLENTRQVATEALDYILRKGTGTHESNQKRIKEVLRYYKLHDY